MSVLGEGVRRLVAPDGRAVALRPLAGSDARALAVLYQGLPADAWVTSLGVGDSHNGGAAARAASVAERGGRGIVAVVAAGGHAGAVAGEGHYEVLPDGDGELTLVVAPEWRDWLGPRLFEAMLDEAAAAGVANLEVEVICSECWMRGLVEARGHALLPTDEWLTTRLVVATSGGTPVWGTRPAPRVLVEAPGGRWHGAEAARRAGMSVMVCGGHGGGACCPLAEGTPCPLAAEADVVVVSYPPEGTEWDELIALHGQLHPGVPVVVESHSGRPVPAGAIALDVHDPADVVDRVAAVVARSRAAR